MKVRTSSTRYGYVGLAPIPLARREPQYFQLGFVATGIFQATAELPLGCMVNSCDTEDEADWSDALVPAITV